ncbi:MAG TPA: hypothetical protein VJB88_10470 [Vicinamibacteria bacterium]|nr:hypothetical protein [Vicinamibacteria bacterium]
MSSDPLGARRPRRVTAVIQSFLDRLEAVSLPRLQTGEIYGAATLGGLIILLLVLRWLVG